jgi:hypothetical protein
MPVRDFRLILGQGEKIEKPKRPAARVRKLAPPSARQAYAALKATAGSGELIEKNPDLGKVLLWKEIASFRVCGKTGTALFLDLWDCDHFDGFTDIPRALSTCQAWFSADGFSVWGSPETKTGRVNCFFRAPAAGIYVCNAQLESSPAASLSVVECLIDSFSFGPLAFTGPITQPHVSVLPAGFHHFRIRQKSGAFFFRSLTVFRIA